MDKVHKTLHSARYDVARGVRALRRERRVTQQELSHALGISQGRLSVLERGTSSFTAEQLLVIMRLFNAPVSHFAPLHQQGDTYAELQNALARLGAIHLREDDSVLPSGKVDAANAAVREALVVGASRLVTALAPVIVRQGSGVSLSRVDAEMRTLGLERRLPWLADNVLAGLRQRLEADPPHALAMTYRRAEVMIGEYARVAAWRASADRIDEAPFDLLDPTVRSQKTLDELKARGSEISKRWHIASGLQPDHFAAALEAAHAGDP